MADDDKTEKATPKKRRDERKKGNIFLSKDAIAVVSLFGTFAALYITGPMIVDEIGDFLYLCMEYAANGPSGSVSMHLSKLVVSGIVAFGKSVAALMAMAILTALAGTFFQTKLLFAPDSIKPKFSRLNPLQGIKKLFSLKSIIEALKGIIKITILIYIIYRYLEKVLPVMINFLYVDVATASGQIFRDSFAMVMQITVAFTVLAGFDFFYQWWDYERQLRMSKQEIKEEYKQTEGDPKIKGKIKENQRKMAQSRMMQQVPNADVVIRNPTHVAVALRYKPELDNAPVVLALGLDELALRIVKVAEQNEVMVIENVPLARALYQDGELNREIPSDLYGAVADVLVYLYKIRTKSDETIKH